MPGNMEVINNELHDFYYPRSVTNNEYDMLHLHLNFF